MMTPEQQAAHAAALTSAAKEMYLTDPEGMNALGFGESWDTMDSDGAAAVPYYIRQATTAITAYEQARADERRALVSRLIDMSMAFQALGLGSVEEDLARIEFDAAERALLASLGIQEEER